jgi:Zn-dependent peptidase ImmA (M78 family)
LFADSRTRPTQTELAKQFGISQQAISRRLKRFKDSINADQRARYLALAARKRKRRIVPLQLNFNDAV